MNNYTVNFNTPETPTNSTTQYFGLVEIIELCAYNFNFLFGFPIHSYVLWLIVTGTGSGVTSEFFILNLSVCEIANSLNGLVFTLSVWFVSLRTFENFLIGLTMTGRPLFQCLICVERYLAVVHPVTFLKSKPLRYRLICCTAAWTISLSSCVCTMFTIVQQTIIHIWILLVQHFLFLSIQLFCLVAVLKALKQSGPGDRKREEENHMKRRAFIIILITTVNSIVMYVPFTFTALFSNLTQRLNRELWITSFTCNVLASFVHPVLYLHRTGKLASMFGAYLQLVPRIHSLNIVKNCFS